MSMRPSIIYGSMPAAPCTGIPVLGDRLRPVGVAAVIAPWNFPLAIPCGMTAAAFTAGNAVLLKPAEQTPGIAAALATLLHTAGVPSEP